jgi:RNA polymerase sigma factor (sigma-70 family)
LLERLRGVLPRPAAGELSDGQLLERYLAGREEAAFALLLRRHGPMVLGVCRRVLRQEQAAEDAFQATFLVLVRRAEAIRPRERVGPWLYGVAYRTALKARTLAARRRQVERDAARPAALVEARDPDDLRPLLDQHLSRLPDCYRVPLVLCDLQGRARRDVARQLGLPEGTLSSRLARARALLGRRLGRRGAALSAGAVAAVLCGEARAALPEPLVAATARAAVSLAAGQAGAVPAQILLVTEGVLRAMTIAKFRVAAAALVSLAVIGLGGGVLTHRALAGKPAGLHERDRGEDAPKAAQQIDDRLIRDRLIRVEVQMPRGGDGGEPVIRVDGRPVKKDRLAGALSRAAGDGRVAGLRIEADAEAPHAAVIAVLDAAAAAAIPRVYIGPPRDKDAKEETGPSVVAVVKGLDYHKHTLTAVSGNKKDGKEKTYELAKDVRVVLNDGLTKDDKGRNGSLTDLAPGATAELQLTPDGKTVSAITVRPWSLHGGVQSVDAAKRTITVTSKGEKGAVEKTFTLAKEARVLLNDGLTKGGKDQEGKLADLTEGTPVTVRVSVVDPKTALEVRPQGRSLHGELKGVDAGSNQITVTVKADAAVVDKEIALVKDARVTVEDGKSTREAKLSDLATGSRVVVQLSVIDPTKAVRVAVHEDK